MRLASHLFIQCLTVQKQYRNYLATFLYWLQDLACQLVQSFALILISWEISHDIFSIICFSDITLDCFLSPRVYSAVPVGKRGKSRMRQNQTNFPL